MSCGLAADGQIVDWNFFLLPTVNRQPFWPMRIILKVVTISL